MADGTGTRGYLLGPRDPLQKSQVQVRTSVRRRLGSQFGSGPGGGGSPWTPGSGEFSGGPAGGCGSPWLLPPQSSRRLLSPLRPHGLLARRTWPPRRLQTASSLFSLSVLPPADTGDFHSGTFQSRDTRPSLPKPRSRR